MRTEPPDRSTTSPGADGDLVPVTFVSSHAREGGAEQYLSLLLARLPEGWAREVVVLEDGPLVVELRAAGHPVTVIPTSPRLPGILRSAAALRGRLRAAPGGVVHANGFKAALVSVVAGLGLRAPVVWVKHDFSYDGPRARLVARRCARVIGVSEAVTRALGAAANGKVHVVPNAIAPVAADPAEGRRRLLAELPPGTRTVVTLVGRLEPNKGHRELFAVAPELVARVPALRVVFVGGDHPSLPAYAEGLRREVAERKLPVSFLGRRVDAVELIAGSDAVVIPSVVTPSGIGRESFSYVGLEAMTVGTPVIAYADGGLPELLGPCGELVEPGDRDALAEALVRVLTDEGRRARLAACGRARSVERFSLERMVDETKERYREAAKGGR